MKNKVLFIFHDANPLSGATASMLEVVCRLHGAAQYEVTALIPDSQLGLHNELDSCGIQYTEAKIFGIRHEQCKGSLAGKKVKSLIAIMLNLLVAIKLALGKERYSLVYTNTTDIYIGAFLSKLTRAKHVWHVREFGLEDQNMNHCFGEKLFYRFLENTSNRVVAISHALESKLTSLGVNKNKISMIYNDVAGSSVTPDRHPNDKEPLSLLIVGSIIEGKGHEFVIDCVAYLKEIGIKVSLGIVGKDTNQYAKNLKRHVKAKGVEDRVLFLGYSSDVHSIRERYDIAVVASISEAFGRVTIEAMQSEMAVIASNCGANPELIESGRNGFLYEPGSIRGFAEIITMIDENRTLLKTVGAQALKDSAQFSSGQAADKIDRLILGLLNVPETPGTA